MVNAGTAEVQGKRPRNWVMIALAVVSVIAAIAIFTHR
jgi:hypothetical protein